MTKDLYTTDDVKQVRTKLYKEQGNKCKLTGLEVDFKDTHLDHAHNSEQLVRGVLHKQSNMCLGKLESLWARYLSYWYPGTLEDFLRASADYLEVSRQSPDTRYRHPGWLRLVKIHFNRLNAKQMDAVLVALGRPSGKNLAERKKIFSSLVLDRDLGYNTIKQQIESAAQLK